MRKEKEWLKDKIKEEERDLKYVYDNYVPYEKVLIADDVYDLIDQLDEPEVTLDRAFDKVAESYYMTKEEIWRLLEWLEVHGGKVTYDEPETLSQEWIDENKVSRIDNLRKMTTSDVVTVEKLKNLLVPNQEEVDRAYKDGYEKGKKYTFYKGYLEGLADKESEPETVADVLADFHKSLERLKKVLGTKVEETTK